MKPRRSVLSPTLHRWIEGAEPHEKRSVVVRVRSRAEADHVAVRLEEIGAESDRQPGGAGSARGGDTLVVTVTPAALRRLAEEPWVQAASEPRRFHLRSQGLETR